MGLPAIPQPRDLVAVDQLCSKVEAWAITTTNVGELQDAAAKLGAIDEYLKRTSKVGRSTLATTILRLETRVGDLLGPAKVGRPLKTSVTADVSLDKDQRSDFRKMAAHPEVVEEVAAEGTDDDPPSRRKVLDRVKERRTKDRRPPLANDARYAAQGLRRAAGRLSTILNDDRYDKNAKAVARAARQDLTEVIQLCQAILKED